MTERENMLRLLNHQEPGWMPNNFVANKVFSPSCVNRDGAHDPSGKRVDILGVPWIVDDVAPLGGAIPDPKFHLLEDICDWEEVIKFPNVDKMDWAGAAAKDLAGYDKSKQLLMTSLEEGSFNRLQAVMGTCEAFMALIEEPEAVMDFFDAHTEWKMKMIKKTKEYYDLDIYMIGDDVCSSDGLLFSKDMYDEFILPQQQKIAKFVLENDMILAHHVCGNCQQILPDIIGYGTQMIETMQPYQNDIVKCKQLYGDKVLFNGGWDAYGPHNSPDATEEMVRGEVRRIVDEYFYDGNFVMYGGCMFPTSVPFETFIEHNSWVDDELMTYSKQALKKIYG